MSSEQNLVCTSLTVPRYMSPRDRAREVYAREWCARSFEEDLEAHFQRGIVISNPVCFLMGRVVRHDAPPEDIVDPWKNQWDRSPDCWHIYLAAGDLVEFFRHEPFTLDYFSFERRNVLRIWPRQTVEKMVRKLTYRYD